MVNDAVLASSGGARRVQSIVNVLSKQSATISQHRITLDDDMMKVHAERFCNPMVRWASLNQACRSTRMTETDSFFCFSACDPSPYTLLVRDCLRSDIHSADVRQGHCGACSNGSRPPWQNSAKTLAMKVEQCRLCWQQQQFQVDPEESGDIYRRSEEAGNVHVRRVGTCQPCTWRT